MGLFEGSDDRRMRLREDARKNGRPGDKKIGNSVPSGQRGFAKGRGSSASGVPLGGSHIQIPFYHHVFTLSSFLVSVFLISLFIMLTGYQKPYEKKAGIPRAIPRSLLSADYALFSFIHSITPSSPSPPFHYPPSISSSITNG